MKTKLFLLITIVISQLSFAQQANDSSDVYIKGIFYIANQNVVIQNMDITLDHSTISGEGTFEIQSNKIQTLTCRSASIKRILVSNPNVLHIENEDSFDTEIVYLSDFNKINPASEANILSKRTNPILKNVACETASTNKDKQYLFFKDTKIKPIKPSLINQQLVLDWAINPLMDMQIAVLMLDTRKSICDITNNFKDWTLSLEDNPPII